MPAMTGMARWINPPADHADRERLGLMSNDGATWATWEGVWGIKKERQGPGDVLPGTQLRTTPRERGRSEGGRKKKEEEPWIWFQQFPLLQATELGNERTNRRCRCCFVFVPRSLACCCCKRRTLARGGWLAARVGQGGLARAA